MPKKTIHKVVIMKLGKFVLVMTCVAALSACDNSKPESMFSAQYSVSQPTLDVAAGSTFSVPFTVKNTSTEIWNSKAVKDPVVASYHWLGSDRKLVVQDGERTSFAEPVKPDSQVTMQLTVRAPKEPGTYTLQAGLLQEGVTWFEAKNVKPLELTVNVK